MGTDTLTGYTSQITPISYQYSLVGLSGVVFEFCLQMSTDCYSR